MLILFVSTISRRMGSAPPQRLARLEPFIYCLPKFATDPDRKYSPLAPYLPINGRVIARVGENVCVGGPYWADRLS